MMNSQDLFLEKNNRFVLLPVAHHSYESTLAVAAAFKTIQPSAVAVEYPAQFQELLFRGIARLPKISVLMYGEKIRNYIRIEPVDPFVEALRLAKEQEIPAHCIDLALGDYPLVFEPLPDSYAISRIGHQTYCSEVLARLPELVTEEDEMRESAMAFHLQQISSGDRGPILVVCGISHLKRLKQKLSSPQPRPFQTPFNGKLYHLSSSFARRNHGTFSILYSGV